MDAESDDKATLIKFAEMNESAVRNYARDRKTFHATPICRSSTEMAIRKANDPKFKLMIEFILHFTDEEITELDEHLTKEYGFYFRPRLGDKGSLWKNNVSCLDSLRNFIINLYHHAYYYP